MKQFHAFRISVLGLALGLSACSSDPENLAPIFDQANTTIDIVEDTVYQGQITATDETAIAYTVASAANNGIFALESDGSYSYTPNADFFGTDTVSVAASDEELTSTASITFNVSNVNDAPVFTNTVISVANNGSTSGVLNFSDVDGDAVTVTLVSTDLVGELTLDSLTGEFTYTAAEFSTVDTQFMVSYTDGVIAEALTATVNLVPSYVTNEDKHAYYYNSDHSHLKRAQNRENTKSAIPCFQKRHRCCTNSILISKKKPTFLRFYKLFRLAEHFLLS